MAFSIWGEAFPAESKNDGLGFQCCILSSYKRCEAFRVPGRQVVGLTWQVPALPRLPDSLEVSKNLADDEWLVDS